MRSRDSGTSSEFIREVDEAVRQDRWMAIWKQYGAYFVGAALAVVVGTAAGVGWQTYQENQRLAHAMSMAAAARLIEEKPAEAASAFASLAESAGGGVGVVARLKAADAEQRAGNTEAKIEILNELAADADAPALYRRLATLLVIQETFDDRDAKSLIGELDQAATPDNPWRASLLELKALAEIKAGETEAARATLKTLLDSPDTPSSLARRAGELLDALGGPLDNDRRTVSQNQNSDDGADER